MGMGQRISESMAMGSANIGDTCISLSITSIQVDNGNILCEMHRYFSFGTQTCGTKLPPLPKMHTAKKLLLGPETQ